MMIAVFLLGVMATCNAIQTLFFVKRESVGKSFEDAMDAMRRNRDVANRDADSWRAAYDQLLLSKGERK